MTDAADPREALPDTVVAALLAGGSGSRFLTSSGGEAATHKLAALLPATSTEPSASVFDRATQHVLRAGFAHVVIVTGAWQPPASVTDASDSVRIVHNADWASGQASSLRVAIDTAAAIGAARIVIGLADQPFVTVDAWRTVARAVGPIAVATYGGRRGNPVALDEQVWSLLPGDGDEGARGLMRIRPDLVREVACSGSPADIDTTEDLRRWQNN